MKGAKNIFQMPEAFQINLSLPNGNVNLSDSIIEHTVVAEDDNPWYKLK